MVRKLERGIRSEQKAGDQAGQEIKRLWGDVEVRDAKKELRVFMDESDLAGAVRKDPGCCVFARACKRIFGSTKVLFFRSVAYVELPEEDGKVKVERFCMPRTMRALIEAFDRGEGVIPKGGFVLKPPLKSRSFDSKRKANALRRAREDVAGENQVLGEVIGLGKGKGKYRDKPVVVDLAVRSGTGKVHFRNKKGK